MGRRRSCWEEEEAEGEEGEVWAEESRDCALSNQLRVLSVGSSAITRTSVPTNSLGNVLEALVVLVALVVLEAVEDQWVEVEVMTVGVWEAVAVAWVGVVVGEDTKPVVQVRVGEVEADTKTTITTITTIITTITTEITNINKINNREATEVEAAIKTMVDGRRKSRNL